MDADTKTIVISGITAIVTSSGVASIFSLYIKDKLDRKGHKNRLQIEHENEQRKKVKEVLSIYKRHLINSADALRGRLNALSNNHTEKKLYVNGNYSNVENGFFQSTIYRILRFYAWIKIIEDRLIFLDTTISTNEDLYFIKYLECIKRVLQRRKLIDNLQNIQSEIDIDLIDRDRLTDMCSWMITKENDVISYTEFLESVVKELPKYKRLCEFIDDINPIENRRRWDRLYFYQLLIMSFINSYGYDFEESHVKKFEALISKIEKTDFITNAINHIKRFRLEGEPNVELLIQMLEFHESEKQNK